MGKGNRGRNKNKNTAKRSITYAEDEESIYGQILEAFGSGRFRVICSDTIERNCKVRGSMYKKVFIEIGDIVLVNFIEGEPSKGIIVEKYFDHEIKELRKRKIIPDNFEHVEETPLQIEFDVSKI